MQLVDRVVLITGAGGGIGRAVAERLAEAGARLVLSDVRGEGLAKTMEALKPWQAKALTVQGDISLPATSETMVAEALQAYGRIDGLVYCAGISIVGTIEELSLEDFEASLKVNVTGAFLCCKAALPHLRAQRGAIVLVGSTASLVGAFHLTAYGASKAAVAGLGRSIAADYAAEGLRVNVICPGPTDTELLRGLLRDRQDAEGAEAFLARVPMRRFAEPREIAEAIVFLLSPAASYVTGSCFTADGGFTAI